MSAKIERSSTAILGANLIKRRESPDKDGSTNDSRREKEKQQQHQDQDAEQQTPADRQSVEKAMTEMRTADSFTQTGMKVEVFDSKEGLRVRLAQANGAIVKVMSAEEFMKLRQAVTGITAARGKILDQKF